MWQYNNTDELYHYGVLGMKWGRRRARATPANSLKKSRRRISDDASEARVIKKKKINQMSNSELKKLNERMNLEQNYSRLNPNHIKKGIAFVAATAGVMNTALNLYNNSDKLVSIAKKHLGK